MKTFKFNSKDVGSPQRGGSARQTPEGLEIIAGGRDIWGNRDECHFYHVRISGDFELRVRIASLTMADVYTKAGLMIRSSLAAEADHVFLLAFGDNQPRNNNNGGLEFQHRLAANGDCVAVYPPQPLAVPADFPVHYPNVWLRLRRRRDVFAAESSQDGVNWKKYCDHAQAFPDSSYLGIAVTSHNEKEAVTGVFSHLQLRQEF